MENKLRWQSRRGTLELDLTLRKFWQNQKRHSPQVLCALAELLALDDNDLQHAIDEGGIAGLSPMARQLAASIGAR